MNNILRRILNLFTTLAVVVVLTFVMSTFTDDDRADIFLQHQGIEPGSTQYDLEYAKAVKKLHLDKPAFYVSIRRSNPEGWHIPIILFHGFDNRFHHYISSILRGDFGFSYLDARPVFSKILDAMKWTLLLVVIAMMIEILISFPLGMLLGMNAGWRIDHVISSLLTAGYAIPKFWIATMGIVFFATAEYGHWMHIFPSVGMWYSSEEQGFLSMLSQSWKKLILPILIMVIPDIAYLTRMIRIGTIDESYKSYVTTAKAKGLSRWETVIKHIFPNALTPTISLLVASIPQALMSALIIEVIFNIPGMGRLMYDSIVHADWAVVFPVFMMSSVVSSFAFLIGDLLISRLNPKMKST